MLDDTTLVRVARSEEAFFDVRCDACKDSIGAVLSQEGHPIAYESRHLNVHGRNLGVMKKN